jgi:hypothetical protein
MSDMRTPDGKPSAESRKEHAAGPHGSFPIFDKKSALDALHLRGHAGSAEEREHIISEAEKYCPTEASAARSVDHHRNS